MLWNGGNLATRGPSVKCVSRFRLASTETAILGLPEIEKVAEQRSERRELNPADVLGVTQWFDDTRGADHRAEVHLGHRCSIRGGITERQFGRQIAGCIARDRDHVDRSRAYRKTLSAVITMAGRTKPGSLP